jgi:predicted O-linked N-acetylglucosamine transferase (SPINDLY family)
MTTTKIHKDEVDWLISVYKTSNDEELQNESLEKLLNYGLNETQIEERFKKIKTEKDELDAFEKAWKKQEERNQYEKYTLIQKIKIFLFGPYELFKFFDSGLTELKESNYKIKFRQRLTLLIFGTVFWIALGIAIFQYYEYKRMQEIEKVDITDWENNRIEKNE